MININCLEGLNLTFPSGCCRRRATATPPTSDESDVSPSPHKVAPPRFRVHNRQPKGRGKQLPLVMSPSLSVRVVSAHRPHIAYLHADYKDYPQLFDEHCLARDCTFCLLDAQGQLLLLTGPCLPLFGCEDPISPPLGFNLLSAWHEQQFFFLTTMFKNVAAGKKPQSVLVYNGDQYRCCGYPITGRNSTFYAALLLIRPDPADFSVEL